LRRLAPVLVAADGPGMGVAAGAGGTGMPGGEESSRDDSALIGPSELSIEDLWDPAIDPVWDGEGVPCRTILLVDRGRSAARLTDVTSAAASGLPRTGSARRPSFRDRPAASPRRLVLTWDGAPGVEALLGRLAPGPYLTTGRVVGSESGDAA